LRDRCGIKYSSVFLIAPVLIAAVAGGADGERLKRAVLAALAFVLAVGISEPLRVGRCELSAAALGAGRITERGHYAATDNPRRFTWRS
jgi:hypothetical protein